MMHIVSRTVSDHQILHSSNTAALSFRFRFSSTSQAIMSPLVKTLPGNMSASEILAFNPKLSSIQYMLPGATDPTDCHPFNLIAPPLTRPDHQRRPIHSNSTLCNVCQATLEYLAYVVEESRSQQSTDEKPHLLDVATHHENLASWLEAWSKNPSCHLCYLLISQLRLPQGAGFLGEIRLEFSWNLESKESGTDASQWRLYIASTRFTRERTQANYPTYMRLQVWPAKDFAHLFGINLKPHPVFGSPDGSSNSDSARDDVSERDDVSARDNASARDDASAKDDTSERENASDGDDARIASDNENSPSPKLVPSDQRDEENDSDNNNEDDKIDFNGDDPADDGSNADRFDGNRSDGAGSGLEENGSEEAGSDADGSDDENRGDQNRSGQPRKIMLDAGSTGSHLTQILVAHWLEKCLKDEDGQHVECNRAKGSWLPTRLIDVEETSENGALRLVSPVETPGAFEPDRRYITLSHCWGEWGSKELPVLKIANERDRFDHGIHPEDLPPTFQHAVEVARWLEG